MNCAHSGILKVYSDLKHTQEQFYVTVYTALFSATKRHNFLFASWEEKMDGCLNYL